jgi:hypothetical protein
MKRRGLLLVIVAGVATAALWPAAGGAATLHGVVVGKQHGLLLVAGSNGIVRTESGRASIGSLVAGARVVGHARRAHLHGVVVKRVGATTFMASNRHLLAIHANDPTPAPAGSVVDTTVTVAPSGELEDENENEVGTVNGTLAVQAIVTAVGTGTVTLSVNGQSVTVDLPAGLTLPASVVGQTVTLNVELGRTGDDDQGDDDGGNSGNNDSGHDGGGGDD